MRKIAIIGAGISGLTCAYRLHRENDVTVFEANDYPGGHTNTIRVERGGRVFDVDTGFIIFNRDNYPNFTAMLDELQVESQATDMSFSVRSDRDRLEWNGSSLNQIFSQRLNLFRPGFLRMLRDIARFNREAPALIAHEDETTTVAEFLKRHGYSREFAENYLIPVGAALWSSPAEGFEVFPIRFVVEFFDNHGLLKFRGRPQWRVIKGGSHRYVKAMTLGFSDRIRLCTPVSSVRRGPDGVRILTDRYGEERFDDAIFACHSDQALSMLADPADAERQIVGAFPYQPNVAILHTDTSVLPRRRRAWGSWNYHVHREDPDRVAVTYNMNMLQGLDSDDVFLVTLNHDHGIDPDRILRRIRYHHPVFTTGRAAALARREEIIDRNHTSFCGAWLGAGFHEDGVRSALEVCEALQKDTVTK
jgi:uncharacterized protein